jgi:hypothetical protein
LSKEFRGQGAEELRPEFTDFQWGKLQKHMKISLVKRKNPGS